MIVFLTLYLGLVSGKQRLELQAAAAVKSIRIVIDGAPLVTMSAPPWLAEIDFGPELQPHEIIAVALNENGDEIARARQYVNVPRPPAEIDVVLDRDAEGKPSRAKLVARHLAQQKPRSAAVKLDDAALSLDVDFNAKLPPVDMKRPHLLAAEMRFADGTVARREVVFGGQFGDSAEAQLTPVAVTRTGTADTLPADGCFAANGAPLHVRSIEESMAQVVVVRDPDTTELRQKLVYAATNMRTVATLDRGTFAHLMSPVPTQLSAPNEVTELFPSTSGFDVSKEGMLFLLTARAMHPPQAPRQWADAVAVAGVRATANGQRRAVVLILGSAADNSRHQPATVRRFLATLGVPLFVWSPADPRPDLAWGSVDDVSTIGKLTEAVARLRKTLAEQRVAWIEADPVTAFRAVVKDDCGYARLAR
jgi:hypothetical protein